jgi:NADPH:quinone reductase-like Zn-dependent oxidoreductase
VQSIISRRSSTIVTRFAVGDRVIGHAVGTDKDSNAAAEGTFQRYAVILERLASPIPDSLPYEDASVLPLALSTAACFRRTSWFESSVRALGGDRGSGSGLGRVHQRRQQRDPARGRRGL